MKHIKTFIRDKDQPYFVPDAQYKFNLQPGIKIGGQIVNADGEPVAGARVYGYLPNTKPDEEGIDVFEETATTDANGMWHMSGAPEDLRGMTLSFVERTDDFPGEKSAVLPEHHAALKTMSDVRTMTVAPKVQATVVDPEGKPIEGAMILLAGRNLFEDYGAKLIPKTDTKGSFELSVPADSPQVFTVFSRDWALKTVRVSSAEESPLTIVMQKGERLVFRTLTEDGRPAAGIQFHPEAPREGPFTGETPVNYLHALDFLSNRNLLNNTTGESGEFLWENAPREKLGYQIISSAYLSQPGGDYGPEGSPHTIVFRPIIPLSITIVADETGGSIEEYRIHEGTHFKSNPAGLWQWHLKRPSKEMQPGQFATHLRTLDREIKYRIQADGFRPAVTPAYDAKQLPNTPVSVEMRLKKDTGYEGLVQTPTKKPAAGAKVYTKIPRREDYRGLLVINGALDESTATAITIADADGVFRLQPHNEPFVCFVSHESGYANLADLDLWEKPEIVLTPWSAVEGVLQTKGKPIEGVEISMKMDDYSSLLEDMPSVQRYFSQQTGPDGRYRFEHVVAGTWRETITYDKTPSKLGPTHTHYADLKIVAGQKLVKRFGAKGITLVGRFVPPKGIDIDWQRSLVTLTQWKDEAHRQWHTRQYLQNLPNGSFELFNVEPAEYELELKVYRNHDRYEEPVVSKVVIITPEDFEKRAAGGILDMGMIKVDADPN
ncbi:MAG: carboxypeptidase-like regulatory domain-containing protein [Planctomycetaceae bacterium]